MSDNEIKPMDLQNDSTNSTLKSLSISQSTSYSSIKSDDDYQSTNENNVQQQQQQDCDKLPLQRQNMHLNLLNKDDDMSIAPPAQPQPQTTTPPPIMKRSIRYSKEFLEKIRKDRSQHIDKIYPDIFKAYCYCMTGKFWNPEKYYDIVQHSFPDELDRIKKFAKKTSQNAQRTQKPNNSYQQSHYRSQQYQNKMHKSLNESKTSTTSSTTNEHKKSTTARTNADKILLDLIKNKDKPVKTTSILDKLLPKTPTDSPVKDKMLPPLFVAPPPPVPPPTPSSNLLDLINNKTQQDKDMNAYKKLLNLLNNETSIQKHKELKNENIIKKLFDKEKQDCVFPTMNPHELPFQNTSIDMALNKILNKSATSSSSSVSTTSNSSSASSSSTTSPLKTLDSLFDKLKVVNKEQTNTNAEQHFNALLSKITKTQQQQQQSQSTQSTIMKWFLQSPQIPQQIKLPDNVLTLKDIESAN